MKTKIITLVTFIFVVGIAAYFINTNKNSFTLFSLGTPNYFKNHDVFGLHNPIVVSRFPANAAKPKALFSLGHAGLWYNANTDGQGFFVNDVSRDDGSHEVVLAWYTYDPAHSGPSNDKFWIYAQGPVVNGIADLTLYTTIGGVFANGQPSPIITPWGSGTFRVNNCNSAVFAFNNTLPDKNGNTTSGEIALSRLSPAHVTSDGINICSGTRTTPRLTNTPINYGHSGAWFNTTQNGQGFFIEFVQMADGTEDLIAGWYTYDPRQNNKQIWYYMQGKYNRSLKYVDVKIYEITNGEFNKRQVPHKSNEVGTARFAFSDCNQGLFYYNFSKNDSLGYYSQLANNFSITRITPIYKYQGVPLCGSNINSANAIIECSSGGLTGQYGSLLDLQTRASTAYPNTCVNVQGYSAVSGFAPCYNDCKFINGYLPPNFTPTTCMTSKPSDETRSQNCPAGQTGLISQSRSYQCIGTTWTPGDWVQIGSTCSGPAPSPTPLPPINGPAGCGTMPANTKIYYDVHNASRFLAAGQGYNLYPYVQAGTRIAPGKGSYQIDDPYPNQIISYHFVHGASGKTEGQFTMAETSSGTDATRYEFVISTCPGSMTPVSPNCYRETQYTGGSINIGTASSASWVCKLEAGKTYYINVKTTACTFGLCRYFLQTSI